MGKHRRKRRRNPKQRNDIQKVFGVYIAQHPFNRLDKPKLRDALFNVGDVAENRFDTLVAELQCLLDSVFSLQVIACLVTYGLTVGVDEKGKAGPTLMGDRFTQAHVELAIAFSLRTSLEKRSVKTADAGTIQKLFKLLPQISQTFSEKRFVRLPNPMTDEERSVVMLQEHLRLHTQLVRNWGHFDEVADTILGLITPLDEIWKTVYGLSGSLIVRIFRDRVRSMDDRFSARLECLRELGSASTLDDFLARLFVFFPADDEYKRSFADFVNSNGPFTQKKRQLLALQFSDGLLHFDFLFSAMEVAKQYGINFEVVEAGFKHLSLAFGDLKDLEAEHVLLGNPVWSHPLVSLGKGLYFCALPQSFFSFAFQILNELASKDLRLKEAWARRKAAYLESEIENAFRDAFPTAAIVPNYKWINADGQYENDLLIQVGSYLVIVEAKSGSISWPAFRGAPVRAKKHFHELIVEPSMQSQRLKEKIDGLMGDAEAAQKELQGFPFDVTIIKKILRLSVTLEDFAILQTKTSLAVDAGWVPNGHLLPPTMILGDLRSVFHILETRAEKIHYFQRRQVIQTSLSYVGDEMDLLGLYLANGFDVGSMEGSKISLAISGMSSQIDEYFDAKANGFLRSRPRRKLTKWWRDICIQFDRREFDGWTEASAILLDTGFDDQQKLEGKFSQVKKSVMTHWQKPEHHSSVMLIPSKARSDAVVLYAYRDVAANGKASAMKSMADQAFDGHEHVQKCLVLGVNLDKMHYPYSSIAVYQR
jgi:hypothetical protein